jgi:hypothetical protein
MRKLLFVLLLLLSGSVQLRSQNPNTAKFPGALVTDADIGIAKNRARAQLSGPLNDADLTISVDNGAAFASPSWASADSEFLKICGVAANVLTVCAGGRGAFGSTPAAHLAGAWISAPLMAEHVNQLAAEVKAVETALGTGFDASGFVKGAASLTTANKIPYITSAGTLAQSAAVLYSGGNIQIPNGQALTFLSGGTNMNMSSGQSGVVVYGDSSGSAYFGLGGATGNDNTVQWKYTRGTVGAGLGEMAFGQFTKTNTNWTHGVTSFYIRGAEAGRFTPNGNFLLGSATDNNADRLQISGSYSTSTATTTGDRAVWSLNANNSLRWKLGLHADESGSNAGSTLSFWSYDDAGNYLAAPLQLRRTGAVLLNTDTDNGVDKLQVAGTASATGFTGPLTGNVTAGSFTAKGRFAAVAANVPRADMAFNARYTTAWVRDDDTQPAAIWTLNNGASELFVAPAAAGNIDWTQALRVLPDGDVSIPKRHQQINFTLYDPNVALAAQTVPGLWRAAYGAATVAGVACMADTGDAVIQIKKNANTNVLASNLTCGNGAWAGAASLAVPSLALGDDLGLQVISGTAKRVNITINYTGN